MNPRVSRRVVLAMLPSAALALVALASSGPACAGPEPGRVHAGSHDAEARAAARRSRRIAEELELLRASPDPDPRRAWASQWAGRYRVGDGLGRNIHIAVAPDAGLSYAWSGCLGVYEANHGDVLQVFEDGLRACLAVDPALSDFAFLSPRLYFVRWGERRYLVPEAQIQSFIDDFNRRPDEPRRLFSAPLREEDAGKPVHGRPMLPEAYAKLLRSRPVEARILSVADVERWRGRGERDGLRAGVELDRGTADGLFRYMRFQWVDPADPSRYAEVVLWKLDPHTARGWFRGSVPAGDESPPPAVGDVLTSRLRAAD